MGVISGYFPGQEQQFPPIKRYTLKCNEMYNFVDIKIGDLEVIGHLGLYLNVFTDLLSISKTLVKYDFSNFVILSE